MVHVIYVFGIFGIGVALWGFAGRPSIWTLFAPRDQSYRHHDPFNR
jgi:hypothetical protein